MTPNACHCRMLCPITEVLPQGSNILGVPIRLELPAAKMIAPTFFPRVAPSAEDSIPIVLQPLHSLLKAQGESRLIRSRGNAAGAHASASAGRSPGRCVESGSKPHGLRF